MDAKLVCTAIIFSMFLTLGQCKPDYKQQPSYKLQELNKLDEFLRTSPQFIRKLEQVVTPYSPHFIYNQETIDDILFLLELLGIEITQCINDTVTILFDDDEQDTSLIDCKYIPDFSNMLFVDSLTSQTLVLLKEQRTSPKM